MSRHLPVAHLSADAVIAVADGLLSGSSLAHAERHLAECDECAHDVVLQRQASFALRSATMPSVPGGLLERLCGLPQEVDLDVPVAAALSPDGEPMLPAYSPTPGWQLPGPDGERKRPRLTPRRWLGH